MAKQILALVDFSSATEDILHAAADLARHENGKCWLVHVAAPDPDFVGYDVGPLYIREDRAEKLRSEHRELQAYRQKFTDQAINCEALLIMGPLFETIDSEIKKLEIDVVVLGSHGRSMFFELMVGSVCEHLLRKSNVPLYIIPAKKS